MGHDVPPEDGNPMGVDCGRCVAGETPEFIKVTFKDLAVCGGKWYPGGPNCIEFFGSGNGIYILKQLEGTPCRWECTKYKKLPRDIYSPDCISYIDTIYENMDISVSRLVAGVTIEAYASGFWPAKCIFKAENVAVAQCANTGLVNNTTTCVDHKDRSAGGTAKVSEGMA